MLDLNRLRRSYEIARRDLLAEQDSSGHWVGKLSASALSTATAVSALAAVARHGAGEDRFSTLIQGGIRWLAGHQNGDGGWGDTDRSLSNIATTMLVRAAFHLAGAAESHAERMQQAERYLRQQDGIAGLRRRYGKDKTFAVPILTNCAIAGLVPWQEVSPLPFELACLPNRLLGLLRIPVVSYAIPGAGGDRPGPLLSRPIFEPAGAMGAAVGRRTQPASAHADAAGKRRIPGGYAADELRRHEPGEHRPLRSSGGTAGRGLPRRVGPSRRLLADQHESRHLGNHTLDPSVGGGRGS